MQKKDKNEILIVGAGPTGLFLAYILATLNVNVRIIDSKPGPTDESKAMGVQARTLEFYRQLGFAEELIDLGIKTENVQLWVDKVKKAQFSLKNMGDNISRYPFLLILPQDVHEKFLIEKLKQKGLQIEWNTELLSINENNFAGVNATIKHHDKEEVVHSEFLIGCDGASSTARKALNIDFSGGTTAGLFYVADVAINFENRDIRVGMAKNTMSLMMPVRKNNFQRLIGIVPEDIAQKNKITFEGVKPISADLLDIEVEKVNWFSTYKVHHRVAKYFRVGHCFLAGDACHIHSPLGGQGMNTGLGDSMNLGWKLAYVLKHSLNESLLETYEKERQPFAKTLITTTDALFEKIVNQNKLSQLVRTKILPFFIKFATSFNISKKFIFKTISQTKISYAKVYKNSSDSNVLTVGDRLPYIAEIDNYESLTQLDWQIHIYGKIEENFEKKVKKISIKMINYPYPDNLRNLGFKQDAVYVIRPDGYIWFYLEEQNFQELEHFMKNLGLN